MIRQFAARALGLSVFLAAAVTAIVAHAGDQLTVEEAVHVAASPTQVWAAIGDFKGLTGWHPAVARTEIVRGTDNQQGAVRAVTTKDGATIVEELLAHDPATFSMRYRIIDSPLPVADYVSTLRVERAGSGSRIVWRSEFDRARDEAGAGMDDMQVREIVAGIYLAGFDGLRGVLGERAGAVR